MQKISVLFMSGIRSDYDLLKPLAVRMKHDVDFDVSFFLCAPHFSDMHNHSYNFVQNDGFPIVNMTQISNKPFQNDTVHNRINIVSKMMESFNTALSKHKPDLVIYLGDREEPLIAAICCTYHGIPTIHIAGGDNCHPKGGDVDEPVRHAISKLSSLHLVMADEHGQRLLQMGEEKFRIKMVGNPGIDSILSTPKLRVEDLNHYSKFDINEKYAILIYHVMSSVSPEDALNEYKLIIECCLEKKINLFIGSPNSDPGYSLLANYALDISKKYEDKISFFKNIPRVEFTNLAKYSSFIIGNSSMGILESGALKKPAINVGERQRGRIHGDNTLFVDSVKSEILQAIDLVTSENFNEKVKRTTFDVYGSGNMAELSIEFIKKTLKHDTLMEKNITF